MLPAQCPGPRPNHPRGRPGVIITKGSFEVRADGTWHPHGPPPEHIFKDATASANLADQWLPDEPVLDFFEHMLDGENFDFLGNLGV